MEVATPCTSSAASPTPGFSSASPPRMPSSSIFPPMKHKRIRAIQGIKGSKAENSSTSRVTHSQPAMGISAWKPAKTPATRHILRRDIRGSFRPFASDTEKASMASPTPSKMLLKKNAKLRFMLHFSLLFTKTRISHDTRVFKQKKTPCIA